MVHTLKSRTVIYLIRTFFFFLSSTHRHVFFRVFLLIKKITKKRWRHKSKTRILMNYFVYEFDVHAFHRGLWYFERRALRFFIGFAPRDLLKLTRFSYDANFNLLKISQKVKFFSLNDSNETWKSKEFREDQNS